MARHFPEVRFGSQWYVCDRDASLTCFSTELTWRILVDLASPAGSIDQNELGNALQSFGFGLSPRLLTIVTQKYSE